MAKLKRAWHLFLRVHKKFLDRASVANYLSFQASNIYENSRYEMVSKNTKIIATAIIAVVVIVGIYVWQSAPAFPEVEKVMDSFIDALNKYDADAAWALMSPGLQSFYGSKANFNSSVLDALRESFWHESGISINDRSVETSDNLTTAFFTVLLKVFYYEPYGRHYGLPTTGLSDVTYTFKLVEMGDQWRIDDWYPNA